MTLRFCSRCGLRPALKGDRCEACRMVLYGIPYHEARAMVEEGITIESLTIDHYDPATLRAR